MQKPVKYFKITQPFKPNVHFGIDLGWSNASGHNQPIYAIEDGIVIYKQVQTSGGKVLHIKHSNGYVSEYAHMNSWLVNKGDKVKKGQQIGTMGKTGRVTGEHLHFGLYKGTSINYSKLSGFINPVSFLTEDYKESSKEVATKPTNNTIKNYKVIKGDNLTKICKKYYGTYSNALADKIVNANKNKYPKITRNFICAGWTLTIPNE